VDTHWNFETKGLKRFAMQGLRIAGAALMMATLAGPIQAPTPTQAKDLEWGNVRPPMTSEADTSDADGFAHLPDFGAVMHPIAVAPNGDVFVAGGGADVNASGVGTCAIATDANDPNSGAATCDGITATRPVLYKSTDGGQKFRPVYLGAAVGAGGTTATSTFIRKVVVSPKYPTDNFVAVVFTTQNFVVGTANASVNTNTNGLAWSTDGGLTWAVTLTGASGAPLSYIDWVTIALSSDFSWTDTAGTIAIGGQWENTAATTVYQANVNTLKNATTTAAQLAAFVAITEGTASAAATAITFDVAYTYSQDPVALARVYSNAANVYGQIRGATGFAALGAGEIILDAGTTAIPTATFGKVGFKDTYSSGGSLFASTTNAAGTPHPPGLPVPVRAVTSVNVPLPLLCSITLPLRPVR